MSTPLIPYRRNAIQPMECMKAGWELIRGQYWLFVGMVVVGLLVGSAVPMGILMGPMMCGLYLAFFKIRRGEPIEFGTLFKGFDYFGNSIVAALLHAVPLVAVLVPAYFLFYVSLILSAAALGDNPSPGAVLGVLFTFALFMLAIFVILVILTIGFTFSYPLIVDRRLSGFDAVKLSFKAAMGNFWRLLAMVILGAFLNGAGVMLCYVGVFFTLPITYAAVAAAYEQVFGLANPNEIVSNLPPPPPSFN
jgi:uncharacterized membrane protein